MDIDGGRKKIWRGTLKKLGESLQGDGEGKEPWRGEALSSSVLLLALTALALAGAVLTPAPCLALACPGPISAPALAPEGIALGIVPVLAVATTGHHTSLGTGPSPCQLQPWQAHQWPCPLLHTRVSPAPHPECLTPPPSRSPTPSLTAACRHLSPLLLQLQEATARLPPPPTAAPFFGGSKPC